MRRVYEKPPIIEALCEFYFSSNQPWDWTIPGLIYAKVGSEFPTKRQFNPLQVELRAETKGTSVQNVVGSVDRMQFLSQDESALIQVGPDFMSVHHLKPYSNWETFKQMISRSLMVYQQVASPQKITRIALRYINRIEIPEKMIDPEQRIELGDFLLAAPSVPKDVPQVFSTWVQRVEIPFKHANGLLALQSGSIHEEGQRDVAFLLDLAFLALQPELVRLDSAMEWVERAHEEIESTFESCITPNTRRLFKEGEHDG